MATMDLFRQAEWWQPFDRCQEDTGRISICYAKYVNILFSFTMDLMKIRMLFLVSTYYIIHFICCCVIGKSAVFTKIRWWQPSSVQVVIIISGFLSLKFALCKKKLFYRFSIPYAPRWSYHTSKYVCGNYWIYSYILHIYIHIYIYTYMLFSVCFGIHVAWWNMYHSGTLNQDRIDVPFSDFFLMPFYYLPALHVSFFSIDSIYYARVFASDSFVLTEFGFYMDSYDLFIHIF